MGAPQRRRDTRYRVQIPLTIRAGSRSQEVVTEDVSFGGLFVRTDTPPALRHLLRIEAELPPESVPFLSHGMPVYSIKPGDPEGRPPGVGIQFYAMGSERTKWDAFINYVRYHAEPVGESPAAGSADESRKFRRYEVVLPVRPKNLAELYTFFTRDVSRGGMFLSTHMEIDIGRELRLEVEHPETSGVFSLEAVVRHRKNGPTAGIGVEFLRLDDARRQAFFEFVASAIPELTDADLLEDDDA